MAVQKVYVRQAFDVSVAQLFDYLSVHENLDILFKPTTAKLLRNGVESTYGLGSVRLVKSIVGSFEETITAYEKNQRIEYKITQGGPLKNHHGVMVFEGNEERSTIAYTIVFEGKLPLMGPIAKNGLQKSVRKGLALLAASNLKVKNEY